MRVEQCTEAETAFYHKLMNNCVAWRIDEGDQQVMAIQAEVIENWEYVTGEHPSQLGRSLPLEAERLSVYRSDSGIYSAFTLGEIKRRRYDRHLEFQFAFYRSEDDHDPLARGIPFIFGFAEAGGTIRLDELGKPQFYDRATKLLDRRVRILGEKEFLQGDGLQPCFDSIQIGRFSFARENLRKIQ